MKHQMDTRNPSTNENRGELDELLDNAARSIAVGEVPAYLYNNDLIFKAEMERIFARSWVFVAHESEIPKNGDFVLRRVGVDQVIVTRDTAGEIHVLSNHCRHRGAHLCQVDQGNATRFRCPYHGWIYKNNGDWAGAPHMNEAYGGRLDPKEYGLLQAPKVASYRGFIFTALSDEAQSFEEYLAGGSSVLDMIAGMGTKGLRVIAPPERYQIKADWKAGAENFTGDVYHVGTAHFSCDLVKFSADFDKLMENTWRLQAGGGHSFLLETLVKWLGPVAENWGFPKDKFDLSELTEAEQYLAKNAPVAIGNFFPNFSYRRSVFQLTPGTEEYDARPFTSFCQWQPVGPGLMEVWNWMFAWEHATEQEAADEYTVGMLGFSSAGFLEMDDTAVWEGSTRVGKSPWHKQAGTTFHYHASPPGSFVDPAPEFEWPGPGILDKDAYNEFRMLDFWRQWIKLMHDEPKADVKSYREAAE